MAKSTRTVVTVKTSGPATVRVDVKTPRKPAARKGLVVGKGNAKLKGVHTFSLPAGWSCPAARDCLSRADRQTGKVKDGPETEFRCFAASDEARHSSVRRARWHNLGLLKAAGGADGMARLILDALPASARTVRVHVSGDFFSQDYFDAWLEVARRRPGVRFYAYTKSLPYWLARRDAVPVNLILTASRGGRHDHLIQSNGLRSARVVFSEAEAADLGLEIDHDDSHAMNPGPDFALLIHGSQPAGSEAARAIATLRKAGEYGYEKAADEARRERGRTPLMTV